MNTWSLSSILLWKRQRVLQAIWIFLHTKNEGGGWGRRKKYRSSARLRASVCPMNQVKSGTRFLPPTESQIGTEHTPIERVHSIGQQKDFRCSIQRPQLCRYRQKHEWSARQLEVNTFSSICVLFMAISGFRSRSTPANDLWHSLHCSSSSAGSSSAISAFSVGGVYLLWVESKNFSGPLS